MLKNLQFHSEKSRNIYFIIALTIVFAGISTYLSLQNFHFLPLVPIALLSILLFLIKTEKFIIFLAASVPLSININDIGSGFGLTLPTEPFIILCFLLFVYYFLLQNKIHYSLLKHPLVYMVLIYIAWMFISAAFSTMPMVSFKFAFARFWYIIVFFIGGIFLFNKIKNIFTFFNAFIFFTIVVILFVLYNQAADNFIRSISSASFHPFFPDHGMYAASIAFAVPPLFFYVFTNNVFRINYNVVIFVFLVLIIALFGIVVSYTRATWISLVAALGVYALLYFKIKFKYIIFALIVVIFYVGINQEKILYNLEANKQGSTEEIGDHVKSVGNISTDPSNLERFNRWSCAMRMAMDKPVFGFGAGTFVFQYAPYQKSNETTIISTHAGDIGDAHSEYFSALSETGFIGLLLWCSIVLLSMGVGFRTVYNAPNRLIKNIATFTLLGLVAYYVHALLNNYSQYDKIAVPLWCSLAILVVLDIYCKKFEIKKEK